MDLLAWIGAAGGVAGGTAAFYVAVRRKAIEKYVAELNRVSYEHEVVFSRLHERRVDVIADLYAKLVAMQQAFAAWVSPMQDRRQEAQDELPGTLLLDQRHASRWITRR